MRWLRYWLLRKRKQTYKPVILVTGCSSGVGLALAHALYKLTNYRVVVTARSTSIMRLAATFPDSHRFWVRPLDVTSAEERASLISEIEREWRGVDILINNAGISYRAVLEHMTSETDHHQMETNYFAPVEMIRLVLHRMRERGRGKIINISSVSGMLAMPTMASYSASKYALEGMSEALWYELKPFGINVSLIQPGFIKSLSFKNVYYTEMSKPDGGKNHVYTDYYNNMAPFVERLMAASLTTPEDIAGTILKVIRTENPPLWIPATLDASVFYYMRRFIPRRFLLPLLFTMLPKSHRWAIAYTNRRRT